MVSDGLLEYQQCQMECAHEIYDDSDSFEDTVPVADQTSSSSKYGAHGGVEQSALLPSDAAQMLRVRMSMPHTRQSLPASTFGSTGLTWRNTCYASLQF